MLASHYPAASRTSFITPGLRLESAHGATLSDEPLTVARLVRDRFGMFHVTLCTGSGREISAFLEQIEIAVSEGHLVPIGGTAASIAR